VNLEPPSQIAVLGAGSWGTALAIQLARAGHLVRLWGRGQAHREAMQQARVNQRYLPEARFPDNLLVAEELKSALAQAEDVLIAVPSHAFRELLTAIRDLLTAGQRLCWATKGFEISSGRLPDEVAQEVLGTGRLTAVLSGPTFAREVGASLPTAMTIASRDADYAEQLAHDFSTPAFRAYTSTDIVGVEVGGAVKNVLAIACGVVEGRRLGQNARAALIARGFAEMTRFGLAMGARRETLAGLSGFGDLVLTCSSTSSRNYSLGIGLGQGRQAADLLSDRRTVAEGAFTAPVLHKLARAKGIDMPIVAGVDALLAGALTVDEVLEALLARPMRAEG